MAKIYLVVFMKNKDFPDQVLDDLELIPENKIVEAVKYKIENEFIDAETLENGKYDLENMTTATAIQILEDDGWTVKEYDL